MEENQLLSADAEEKESAAPVTEKGDADSDLTASTATTDETDIATNPETPVKIYCVFRFRRRYTAPYNYNPTSMDGLADRLLLDCLHNRSNAFGHMELYFQPQIHI